MQVPCIRAHVEGTLARTDTQREMDDTHGDTSLQPGTRKVDNMRLGCLLSVPRRMERRRGETKERQKKWRGREGEGKGQREEQMRGSEGGRERGRVVWVRESEIMSEKRREGALS